MKLLRLYLLGLTTWLLAGCQKELTQPVVHGAVQLQLQHTAGSQPLVLNTTYSNRFGEDFTLSKFKYYISNIALVDAADQKHPVPDTYFLVDENNPASKTFSINAEGGNYKAIQFLLGVDSTRNVSGAQTGALDPMLDMFWTWNTGYIMAKLEGTAPLSNLPNQKVEYHIGGFKGADGVLRTVTLPFNQTYTIAENKPLTIQLNADIFNWFDAVHSLPIAAQPTCTAPGSLASRFADNYARMFTITSILQP